MPAAVSLALRARLTAHPALFLNPRARLCTEQHGASPRCRPTRSRAPSSPPIRLEPRLATAPRAPALPSGPVCIQIAPGLTRCNSVSWPLPAPTSPACPVHERGVCTLPRARARPLHAARRKGPAPHGQSVLPPGLRSSQQTQPARCSSRPSSSWPAQGGLRLTPLSRCHLHQEARPPILHQPAVSTGDPRAPPGGGPILQRHPVSPLPTQRPVPRWQLPGP